MPFVLDASIALTWCFDDEANAAADVLLDRMESESALAPSLWLLEISNALLVAERRRRLTEAECDHAIGLLLQLPIVIDDRVPDSRRLVSIGRRHGLSAYDSTYLALAVDHGVALATLDAGLAAASDAAGVELLIADVS